MPHARVIPSPANDAATGIQKAITMRRAHVASQKGEYFNCVYAVRSTICQMSPSNEYDLRPRAACVRPIHVVNPARFTLAASVQSSMRAPLRDAKPPIAASARRSTSTQPPLAAAILEPGLFESLN